MTDPVIRRATLADAPGVAACMGGAESFPMTLQQPHVDVALWQERLAKPLPGSTPLVAELGGEVVGMLNLFKVDGGNPRRAHVLSLGMAVRDDRHGRGIGTALLRAALEVADDWLAALRIELTVFADNAPAIALYQRHGFEVEGRMRAHALRGGAYVDSLLMARLHPRPPRLPLPQETTP
ncbi:GNAT family N-acetyltransferase [Derxia lacustris]|uniref:GNAT family N-acetyltransferase n=1 Tax=Derxia lacustris TaxID=764842 RepID=UPI000A1700A6|nr:GNAT family N-acetyltransferase [Derxia lacustris]